MYLNAALFIHFANLDLPRKIKDDVLKFTRSFMHIYP